MVLDSSHLGLIASDKFSNEASRRNDAKRFEEALLHKGYLLLISWHHIYELLKHRDERTATKRAAFLRSLPVVSWIESFNEKNQFGSVLDILIAETQAAWETKKATPVMIRAAAEMKLIKHGSGADISLAIEVWHQLKDELFKREARDRELIALSRSTQFDISRTKISEWLNQQLRSPEEAAAHLKKFRKNLVEEIATRGDKKIPDATNVADRFLEDIRNDYKFLTRHQNNPGLQVLLRHGIEISDLARDPTMGELTDLAMFRKQLEVANRKLGLPWKELKDTVSKSQLPSWIIQDALRKYGQDLPERKGSELSDAHLACLSAYADITYVDKRTFENFTRARKKSPTFAEITRSVHKASRYQDVLNHL